MIRRLPVLFAGLAACVEPPPWEGTFDVPGPTAVLQDATGGPFTDPVAYAASTDGGQIAIMDLRKGIYLADQPTASFVRAAHLPTGRDRVISGLAAYAPDDANVDVWAADRAFSSLLRVPHVRGVDAETGWPLRVEPTAAEPVFVDADASGDSPPKVEGVRTRLGYTTTEVWTFQMTRGVWVARGSRSGRQETDPVPGLPWSADKRALELTILGTASEGDRIEIATDSGIEEHDIGGVPMAMAISPDQRWLAVSVTDPDAGDSFLRIVDPATGTVLADAGLPADAVPGRLAWTPDATTLYAADFQQPAVWGVAFDLAGPGAVTEHVLPWSVTDVAPLRQEDGTDLLYVSPVDGRTVWIYDTGAGALLDFNPTEPGVNGLDFDTPVRGLEALPMAYENPQPDDDGIRSWRRSVAVSLYNGSLVFMRDGDGCLVGDPLGPRTDVNEQSTGALDYTTNYDPDGGAFLEGNAANDRSVLVNRCGGIARREAWTLTYRRDLQAWEVEGSRSGPQSRLAYEDQRYLSDTGAVSFTIRGGVLASEDGWRIGFTILPGVVSANADADGDGDRDIDFELPGDPSFFHHETIEQREDGWVEIRESPFVLVPAEAGDLCGRVDPRTGDIQVTWW